MDNVGVELLTVGISVPMGWQCQKSANLRLIFSRNQSLRRPLMQKDIGIQMVDAKFALFVFC